MRSYQVRARWSRQKPLSRNRRERSRSALLLRALLNDKMKLSAISDGLVDLAAFVGRGKLAGAMLIEPGTGRI